jgi:hypothetical protein
MKLYDIIKDVAKTSLPDMEISDVTSDTRKLSTNILSLTFPIIILFTKPRYIPEQS